LQKIGTTLKDILNKSLFLSSSPRTQRLFLSIFLFIVIYSILAVAVMPTRFTLQVGQVSPEAIYAPRDFLDEYTTENMREEAAAAVPDIYDYDPSVLERARDSLGEFFDMLHRTRAQKNQVDSNVQEGAPNTGQGEDDSLASFPPLLELDRRELIELEKRVEQLLASKLESGVKVNELLSARQQLSQELELIPYSLEVIDAVKDVALPLVRANMFFNPIATAEEKEKARESVEPLWIPKNTRIIDKGERVTEKHLKQLETLGLLQGSGAHYMGYLGLLILLLIIFIVVGIYLAIFAKTFYQNPSLLFLIGLITIITLAFAIAANFFSAYLIPVAMGVILIAVLLDTNLAILFNIVFALLVGLITGTNFNYMFVAFVGGMAAVYGVARLYRRNDLARAGIYVAVVNVVTIFALFVLTVDFRLEYLFLRDLSIALFSGVGSGLFSAVMAIGLLPYLESAFNLTTAVTLLELSNPNQPLLKKMLIEAPGSYHHSIVVGNLAEAAAEELKADPLLARVGAYYHDLGKIKRPYFFTENQFSGENPHKNLSPNLSALIIRSHVKDGYEMAKNAKMPKVITDIIRQHHGTGLVSFFYQKALESGRYEKVNEEDFRYEGPLPQTKEAAIIMLADSVEAAVRSLSKPTVGRVEGTVRKIIKEKLNDGQLDECPLTLQELDKIGDIFTHILSGIFHTRIEYPEKELKAEIEGSGAK
jgi:putative nucleotidyltransferase with HDIG domain